MTDDLKVAVADEVAVVEIRRPPANYFDEPLITKVADAYAELDEDQACRVVVLCSEGKHFCAGADFRSGDGADVAGESVARFYSQALRLFRARKPVVAAVQGSAIGGGLGLALSADFRVGGPSSRFAANFSQLGFHPGFGITVTLPAIVGEQLALEYLLTGRRVTGEQAYRAGLLDDLAPDEEIRASAIRFARQIATSAPLAVVSIKQTMRRALVERVAAAIRHEHQEQTQLRATADFAEGIAASSERRTPQFTGR